MGNIQTTNNDSLESTFSIIENVEINDINIITEQPDKEDIKKINNGNKVSLNKHVEFDNCYYRFGLSNKLNNKYNILVKKHDILIDKYDKLKKEFEYLKNKKDL